MKIKWLIRMRILAFDVTNVVGSVALGGDLALIEGVKATEGLVVEIEGVLARNSVEYGDLDVVAVTKGPGSFTTTRIGLAAAKMFDLAGFERVVCYDSLAVLAYKFREFEGRVLVVMDARMDEFFVFEKGWEESKLLTREEVLALDFSGDLLICGSGKAVLRDVARGAEFAGDEDEFSADGLAEMVRDGVLGGDLAVNYVREGSYSKGKGV